MNAQNKKAIKEFNALMNVYAMSEAEANAMLAIAYDNDIADHNAQIALLQRIALEASIQRAQVKRNMSADTDTTSKFCRLLQSNKQNYRIDKALESFHTMRELMTITDCSEARIKSHIVYIQKNCFTHCKLERDDKKFRFVVIEH